MRHGKKINHLSRKTAHRKAMLSNMANSLIEHKRISTTVAKAKALRVYVEPLLTKSKEDSTHNRRTVFSYLKNKYAVSELFREIAPKIAERSGGYTRIIKTGNRLGDNAEMAMIELVDFNEIYTADSKSAKGKTRRSRRGNSVSKPEVSAKSTTDPIVEDAKVVDETTEEKPNIEEVKSETVESPSESENKEKEESKQKGE